MARGTWLVKTEPSTYAWGDLVRDGRTRWDGVRNHAARNHLAGMHEGDLVLVYHSGDERAVVGVARVVGEAYPDPTAREGSWLAVDLEPVKAVARPVALAEIKAQAALRGIPLVRQGRLSVMPLPAEAFERILALGKTKLR
ncbi:MAG TPA: EVE domain-containing protein, partial [Solirubrobacterales bacterium]|nr:EVE domain-containing protein [Solirubrobacterales bacterium]